MKEIIFLNGKFIPREEARISALTPGFLYGWGLFETMRCFNKRIVYFDSHLERIKKSCVSLGIKFPCPLDKLKKIIQAAVKINAFPDACVRLSLWKSEKATDTLVTVKKYRPYLTRKYREGFSACISRYRQNELSYLARHKTANYLIYQLAILEAGGRGLDEAILLNNRGFISEASRSNIFFVKDKEICTPALACGCLNGITRKVILRLAKKYSISACEGNFSLHDLYAADEAFLTNSLMGIMPLTHVEKNRIGRAKRGRITQFFCKKYNSLLKNGT